MNRDPSLVPPAVPLHGGKIAIQLDDVQAAGAARQRFGQRAGTRADFEHRILRLRRYRGLDGGNDAGIDQKVLAETFPCTVPGHALQEH